MDNPIRNICGIVYVEGDAGEIDQKVSQQFAQLKQVILGVYQRERNTGALPLALPTMSKIEMAVNQFGLDNR